MTLEEQLIMHEGLRLKPYRDTMGKLTIGVGRNLIDVGISHDEAMMLLHHDVQRLRAALPRRIAVWEQLSPLRQRVLLDMAFNLGLRALMQFTQMLAALQRQDFERAAQEMLCSQWAHQVGERARRLARWMRTDEES